MLGGYIMGYRLFMLNILAFTLALGSLSANAQPILPISPMIPGLVSTPAQQEQDEKLTLDRAVDFAMRNHPLIRAAASGREIVDAQLSEAQAGHWPLFQFSEIFTRSNNPVFVFGSLLEQSRFGPQNFNIDSLNNPSSLSNFRTALIVRMPIFNQLETDTKIAQARIGQDQAEKQQDQVKQQVRLEVIRNYYGVLVVEGKRDVAAEAVKMAEAEVGRIRDFFETGLVVQSDLLAAEVQLSEFRQQEIQAVGEVITTYAALNTALGLPIHTPQKIAGRLAEKNFAVPGVEDLVQSALTYRPDYARANLMVRSMEKRVRGAWGQYLPKVDVFSTYGMSGRDLTSGSSDYAIGAGLTYNIFDQSRSAKLDQARAAQSMAAAEQEHLSNQIRLEVVRAYQQYVSIRERLNLATEVVAQAQEALRIVQDRYREGLTTITEVLRAQIAFVRTRQNLLGARYEYYLSYAQVLIVSGRLSDVQPFVS
jgi:outer membrane protein TolC